MLHLNDSLVIGKGAHRICYRHPKDINKCVKIPNQSECLDQALECEYYQYLESINISWKHLSRYYGEIYTNLGNGYVYELIKNYDHTISKSLSDYFSVFPTNKISIEIITQSLFDLKKYLLEYNISVKNLRPYNILFKKISPQNGYFVIIDNIGHHKNHFYGYSTFDFLVKFDINKKWKKFELALSKEAKIQI